MLPQARQLGNDAAGPTVHIIFLDHLPHSQHASFLLFLGHGGGDADSLGEFFRGVRIDRHRLGQFTDSPGETTQEKNALLILPGGDILLSHHDHADM